MTFPFTRATVAVAPDPFPFVGRTYSASEESSIVSKVSSRFRKVFDDDITPPVKSSKSNFPT